MLLLLSRLGVLHVSLYSAFCCPSFLVLCYESSLVFLILCLLLLRVRVMFLVIDDCHACVSLAPVFSYEWLWSRIRRWLSLINNATNVRAAQAPTVKHNE